MRGHLVGARIRYVKKSQQVNRCSAWELSERATSIICRITGLGIENTSGD